LSHAVAEFDVASKVAIDLDAGGGTC
jgi:hypothetical protein